MQMWIGPRQMNHQSTSFLYVIRAHIQILFGREGVSAFLDRLIYLDRQNISRPFVLIRNCDTSSTD